MADKKTMKYALGDLVITRFGQRWWWSGRLGLYVCSGVENGDPHWIDKGYHTLIIADHRTWLHEDMFERVI